MYGIIFPVKNAFGGIHDKAKVAKNHIVLPLKSICILSEPRLIFDGIVEIAVCIFQGKMKPELVTDGNVEFNAFSGTNSAEASVGCIRCSFRQ